MNRRTIPGVLVAAVLVLTGYLQGQTPPPSGYVTAINYSGGFNSTDATACLQAAINSGAGKIWVPYMGSDWNVTPITLSSSNQELLFESGVIVSAKRGYPNFSGRYDCLFTATDKSNLILSGYGATFRMWKSDYTVSPYTAGEWRMGIKLSGCSNVTISGLTIKDTGGDGIYLSTSANQAYCQNVLIEDVVCDNNYRQGLSVISADTLTIEGCVFKNTSGTAPEAGIDLEPNATNERLVDIIIRDCTFENNNGPGMLVYLAELSSNSMDVDILFENCYVKSGNSFGMTVGAVKDTGPLGTIEFRGCRVENTAKAGAYVYDKSADKARVRFNECVLKNVAISTAAPGSDDPPINAPVSIYLRRSVMTVGHGGVDMVNCQVFDGKDRSFLVVRENGTNYGVSDLQGNFSIFNLHDVSVDLGTTYSDVNIVLNEFYPTIGFEPDVYTTGELVGQDGWATDMVLSVGERVVVQGGTPSPPQGTQMGKISKTTTGNTNAVRVSTSFASSNDPIDFSFNVSLRAAYSGSMGTDDFGLFYISSTNNMFYGVIFGFKKADASNVYLTYRDGENFVLIDADPGTPGTTDPASASTFYKFRTEINPSAGTYKISIFGPSGNLIKQVTNVSIRGGLSSFDKITPYIIPAVSSSLYSLYFDDIIVFKGFYPPINFEEDSYITGELVGQDGWTTDSMTGTRTIIQDSTPQAPQGRQMVKLSKTANNNTYAVRAIRSFSDSGLASVSTPQFNVSLKAAFDGTIGNGDMGIFYISSTINKFYGVIFGFKKADANNVYLTYRNGENFVLVDSDPSTPGTTDPASASTFYRFWVQIDPPAGTYTINIYDDSENLIKTVSSVYIRGGLDDFDILSSYISPVVSSSLYSLYADDIQIGSGLGQ